MKIARRLAHFERNDITYMRDGALGGAALLE
jgi:hypothetical protein